MAAKFVAEDGSLKGLVLSLEDGDHWIIGRDPDSCQLLVEDPLASRKHVACRTTPDGILIENLSRTNPVEINDEEVTEPRLLQNGDAVRIGSGIFRFYAEAAAQLFKESTQDTYNGSKSINTNNNHDGFIEEKSNADNNSTPEEKKTSELPEEELKPESNQEQKPMEISSEQDAEIKENENLEISQTSVLPNQSKSFDEVITEDEESQPQDTIYEDDDSDKNALAEINFGILDTGRWLLKVIGGPNNGAEFSMQTGSSYVIGTDPNACDIVFHDTSVSRQHARISIGQDDNLTIEDLKSRNGTIIDGEQLKGKGTLKANTLISLGTTSFVVFDREGEMQTIISPLMPSIVKVLQNEEPQKILEENKKEEPIPVSIDEKNTDKHQHHATTLGAFILIGILTGLFVIVGIGTSTLFKSEPIATVQEADPILSLDTALTAFPNVKYTFNKNTGQLLLVGHVLTFPDRSQLLYALQGLKFIKSLDDSGIVIDEYVWREANQILEGNPEWKGINVMVTTPGHFAVSGYLKTRTQANRLSEYLSANFPYPDLLEKKIVVDEEVVSSINTLLQSKGLTSINTKLDNGELTLSGGFAVGKESDFEALLAEIKDISGVRTIRNLVVSQAPESSVINISDKYEVTGSSKQAGKLSVVINGRILMKGDALDGMTITQIQPNAVFLEKDYSHYRIDFNR